MNLRRNPLLATIDPIFILSRFGMNRLCSAVVFYRIRMYCLPMFMADIIVRTICTEMQQNMKLY